MKKSSNALALTTALSIGIALSITGYWYADLIEHRQISSRFRHLTDLRADALRQQLEVDLEVIRGLQGLYDASVSVERNEFRAFTGPILARHSEIQALEWIPRVHKDQREEYEAMARADGLSDFHFTELNEGRLQAARPDREFYYPVFYVEPLAGNESAVGLDLASNSSRLVSLTAARDSGRLIATGPIKLVQEKAQQLGFLVFAPLYKGTAASIEQRRDSHYGFVLGVFRIGDVFYGSGQIFEDFPDGIEFLIEDISDSGNRVELLRQRYGREDSDLMPESYGLPIAIAGRQWRITAGYTREFVDRAYENTPSLIFAGGLLLTLLGTGYLRSVLNRQSEVESLVLSRTIELQESENKITAILDTVIDAIITIDSTGIVQQFNPAAEKMFGYQRQEVIGHNINRLMPEPYHSAHDSYLKHYLDTGEARILGIGREVRGRRKDGSVFPLSLSVGKMELKHEVMFVGALMDLTLQKQAEELLIEARDKAEEANRQKSSFVNMMSHELRTPLTVILGYLPLLRNSTSVPPAETVAEIAGDMNASGQHLLELINDLLDISKIEAGQLHLNLQILKAGEICAQAVDKLRGAAEKKGLVLINQATAGNVRADPMRIQQILINLIGNAIKFTEQGTITLTARPGNGFVRFQVEDTGQGIEAEQLSRIFERFHQVDNSSTRGAGGSGLGLTISRYLVELHGGEIHATSEPNAGSRFSFTIPENKEPHNGEDPAG